MVLEITTTGGTWKDSAANVVPSTTIPSFMISVNENTVELMMTLETLREWEKIPVVVVVAVGWWKRSFPITNLEALSTAETKTLVTLEMFTILVMALRVMKMLDSETL
jgi:hypothetical protein